MHRVLNDGRNESFIFAASARTPRMHVWIYDHKTLGKDKQIAEGEVDVRAMFELRRSSLILTFATLDLEPYPSWSKPHG